jgi:hypothetical protein
MGCSPVTGDLDGGDITVAARDPERVRGRSAGRLGLALFCRLPRRHGQNFHSLFSSFWVRAVGVLARAGKTWFRRCSCRFSHPDLSNDAMPQWSCVHRVASRYIGMAKRGPKPPLVSPYRSQAAWVLIVAQGAAAGYLSQPKRASQAAFRVATHPARGRVGSCDLPSLPLRCIFHCFEYGDHLLQLSADLSFRDRVRDNFAQK